MSEAVSIDRNEATANNIDALGRKWVIMNVPHSSRCFVSRQPHRADYKIPESLGGQWTHRSYLQDKLDQYLKRSWDHATEARAKADARKK